MVISPFEKDGSPVIRPSSEATLGDRVIDHAAEGLAGSADDMTAALARIIDECRAELDSEDARQSWCSEPARRWREKWSREKGTADLTGMGLA